MSTMAIDLKGSFLHYCVGITFTDFSLKVPWHQKVLFNYIIKNAVHSAENMKFNMYSKNI